MKTCELQDEGGEIQEVGCRWSEYEAKIAFFCFESFTVGDPHVKV